MAAVPFKVTMIVKGGSLPLIPLTGSDVTTEFLIFPSGSSETSLSNQPITITDLIFSAAGTDTSNVELFVNGNSTNIKIQNANQLGTVIGRPVQQSPISIPAGAQVKFKQLT